MNQAQLKYQRCDPRAGTPWNVRSADPREAKGRRNNTNHVTICEAAGGTDNSDCGHGTPAGLVAAFAVSYTEAVQGVLRVVHLLADAVIPVRNKACGAFRVLLSKLQLRTQHAPAMSVRIAKRSSRLVDERTLYQAAMINNYLLRQGLRDGHPMLGTAVSHCTRHEHQSLPS